MKRKKKPVQPRHEQRCSVCSHVSRAEIEQAFLNWMGLGRIARKYHISRDAIYRHAHAVGLMEERRRNVGAALERIIEHCDQVKPNAAAIVTAVSAYARLNARGELIERRHTVNLTELFNKMSAAELDAYAKTGALPTWFEGTLSGDLIRNRVESKSEASH